MVLIFSLVFSFLLVRLTLAAPAHHADLVVKDRTIKDRSVGCNFPFASCASCSNGVVTFNYGSGSLLGSLTSSGAIRFTVKYANAQRFQPPQIAPITLGTFLNATSLPPMCPQPFVSSSQYSEDCLYFVVYAPTNITPAIWSGGAPVLVWIHGGSYYYGSASDPIIDGSKLAAATGSIVVVPQYRLGALGYLPPSSYSANKNLGIQDVITALKYIQNVIGIMGGDKTKVVLAGQSSGANIIRNLLATPSANNLFSRAILASDPMNYGFLQPSTFTNLQTALYSSLNCGNCLTTSLPDIITAQSNLISQAPSIDPAAGMAQPIRPVLDGTLIQYSLTTTFPQTLKNLLITTVKDEAGSVTYDSIGYPIPPAYFDFVAGQIYGTDRAADVEDYYGTKERQTDDIRPDLVTIGTDGAWRCPNYSFARTWASKGGNIWVAEYTLGSTYPVNAGFEFCTTGGHVCHQDDLPIVFGTATSPTAAQTALIAQVQARWGAFIRTGNPNTSGYQNWSQVPYSGVVPVMNLGGTSAIPLGACAPTVWGSSILYDYQIYSQ